MVAPQRLARVRRFALLLLLYVLTLSSLALAKSWEITDFHDTVSISESGRIVVSERIELSFVGEWHGIQIDQCTHCHGIWFDAAQAHAVLEHAEPNIIARAVRAVMRGVSGARVDDL